jgi:hypothetical protein
VNISPKTSAIIEDVKLFHDQEKTRNLIEKLGIDAAAEMPGIPDRWNFPVS